jgi:predicted enzyme related to lactoylglutathione lyase
MKPCAEGGFAPRTPVCTIDVPSVDEALAKIEASGGKVVMPRMEVPGVGFLAYFADTEGVISGIMQFAPKAPAAS